MLTLVAKRRLEPFFHDGSDNALYRLGIIYVRERTFGDGQFQELAEWLPTISHFENQQPFWVYVCPDIGNMFIESSDKVIMIMHPTIEVVIDRRLHVSTRVGAGQELYPFFAKERALDGMLPLLRGPHGKHNFSITVVLSQWGIAGAGREIDCCGKALEKRIPIRRTVSHLFPELPVLGPFWEARHHVISGVTHLL